MFCTHTILKDTAYNFPRRNFISDLAGGPYLLHLNSQALYVRTTAFKELSLRADIRVFFIIGLFCCLSCQWFVCVCFVFLFLFCFCQLFLRKQTRAGTRLQRSNILFNKRKLNLKQYGLRCSRTRRKTLE